MTEDEVLDKAAHRKQTQKLLSTGDVAYVLGVSEATVKRWANVGKLASIRTVGSHRKFRAEDVASFATEMEKERAQ